MLSRLITDEKLLEQLVIAYFDPDTNSNAQLRQSLSYFLPVYCHSRAENSHRMANITPTVVSKLCMIRENLLDDGDMEDDSGENMVKLALVGQMLLDWTDPRKIVGFAEVARTDAAAAGAGETHYLLVQRLLERMVGKSSTQVSKDERKVFFSMLGKVHLPDRTCGPELLTECCQGVAEAIESGLATDVTSRNILKKLQATLLDQMNAVATAERGGGSAEETILETTELPAAGGADSTEVQGDIMASFQDEGEDEDVTQTGKALRDTTLGATGFGQTTIGAPDAEGTRMVFGEGDGDTEMVDASDDYTEV